MCKGCYYRFSIVIDHPRAIGVYIYVHKIYSLTYFRITIYFYI